MKHHAWVAALLLAGWACRAGEFEIRNADEFAKIVAPNTKLRTVATGFKFIEGPVWVPATNGGYLVFSDIPADELKKWTAKDGVTTFRQPSGKANGNTLDLQANLLTAEHGGRRISVTERSGAVRTVTEAFDGRKFNSPNDVVMRKDGTVWFTDPDYGLEGRQKEQNGNFVFCYDSRNASVHVVATDFDKPNGLCFSPDEGLLYIADSGQPRHIRVFVPTPEGNLTAGRVFCKIDLGSPDGIRCDADGRLYSSAGDGIHIFGKDGQLIGKILVPESPANLSFGEEDLKTLFITARTSLYSIRLLVKGPDLPKPRVPRSKPRPLNELGPVRMTPPSK